ncbi:MAG: NinH [Plesiomonas shigelloides]
MQFDVTSIPALWAKLEHNQTKVAEHLKINRHTVRQYIRDDECKRHAVVNGVFMSANNGRANNGAKWREK